MANQYFKVSYPPNLLAMITDFKTPRYPQGWCGTWSSHKVPVQIDCYDDAQGFCLAQWPIGPSALPGGMQDGTVMTVQTQTAYNALLAQEVALTTDGSNGVWTGSILANRWN